MSKQVEKSASESVQKSISKFVSPQDSQITKKTESKEIIILPIRLFL